MFSVAKYIKATSCPPEDSSIHNPAPRFRKCFFLSKSPMRAVLHCSGLGIGYFYLNGKKVSKDLFTAPVSDYSKTVWYCTYDVTELIRKGENVIAAILGNGFYNETFTTPWDFDRAPWRDVPKLIAELHIDYSDGNHTIIPSDDTWKATEQSPYIFNALRSGETYDARLFEPGWNTVEFDDRTWEDALLDSNPPTGVLRPCTCEPIREFDVYEPEKIAKIDDAYVFSFPQNISGYIRLDTTTLQPNQRITIQYAEDLDECGDIGYLGCQLSYYPNCRYAYSEFIANGDAFLWSPRFSYFGFRYVKVCGLCEPPTKDLVKAVFVHQALPLNAGFSCSDERLNRLYKMGIYSSWCNFFYAPTDCPTREKLGWANDAQASTEQFLINFRSERFLKKWYQDILDSMREDGSIPGIIPTSGWGYEWGAGPTSTGILFEIPWRIYQYSADDTLLRQNTGAFLKHLQFIVSMADSRGFPDYGLCDWAGPWEDLESSPVPRAFSNTLLYIKFLRITSFALQLNEKDNTALKDEELRITKLFLDAYFDDSGKLLLPYQCSLSMCIALNVCPDISILGEQLIEVVIQNNYHLCCGMLGIQYLYEALNKIGRQDLAYRIVTAEGFPSYFSWIDERDATTLCETWKYDESQNHHMYSNMLAWMMRTLAGIQPSKPGFEECLIKPYFPASLDYCDAWEDTFHGRITVRWQKESAGTHVKICIPNNVCAKFEVESVSIPLSSGENHIML